MRRRLRIIVPVFAPVSLSITLLAACSMQLDVVGPGQASLHPLVIGWERFFKLDWQADTRHGRPVVSGYLLNDWGMPAARIQLLVESLGPDGEILGQRVAWLGGGVLTPGSRAYFEIPPVEPAPAYRVSVFAFDWVQSDGGRVFDR